MSNKVLSIILFFAIFLFSTCLFAQEQADKGNEISKEIEKLKKEIEKIQQKMEEKEIEELQKDALLYSKVVEEKKENMKSFKSGNRSLQYLNPEISVTGDSFASFLIQSPHYNDEARSGFFVRGLGVHLQSALDPFTTMKAAFSINMGGVEFGEAYMRWTSLFKGVSLMAGKFRQQFGVVNRWHKHGLDQFDFPLPILEIFGEGGLNQVGVSFHAILPSITADANELTLQITNGMNKKVFSGQYFSIPSVLLRFKNYWDLSENTYFEIGLTGMFGANNRYGIKTTQTDPATGQVVEKVVDEDFRKTILFGADFTLQWQPLKRALYKRFTWRTEFYGLMKDEVKDTLKVYGFYSYIDWQILRTLIIGTRFDMVNPYDLNDTSKWKMQIVPYITFYESPWVHIRLEFQHRFANYSGFDNEDWVFLQVVWAAGPHKHERY